MWWQISNIVFYLPLTFSCWNGSLYSWAHGPNCSNHDTTSSGVQWETGLLMSRSCCSTTPLLQWYTNTITWWKHTDVTKEQGTATARSLFCRRNHMQGKKDYFTKLWLVRSGRLTGLHGGRSRSHMLNYLPPLEVTEWVRQCPLTKQFSGNQTIFRVLEIKGQETGTKVDPQQQESAECRK